MRSFRIVLGTIGLLLALSLPGQSQALSDPPLNAAKPTVGPKINFSTSVYDFGKVSAGDLVKYSFVFTNSGDQILIITNVHPSCGCTTTADWTKEVEPGGTGTIPVQFNSANFGGAVAKMVTVSCNDPSQQTVYLQIKGTVWKPVEISPPYGVINVLPDAASGEAKINIVNNMEESITLGKPDINQPGFAAAISTLQPGKAFELTISTVPPLKPGNTQAEIRIPTSATNLPFLSVRAWANVQPPLSILPAQITLPASPLTAKVTSIVTIVNNTTNPLALSEPAINVQGAECQIREVQPGHYFTISVAFPQGFEMKDGRKGELSLKSNHPKYAKINIPITAQNSVQRTTSPPGAAASLPTPKGESATPLVPSPPSKS